MKDHISPNKKEVIGHYFYVQNFLMVTKKEYLKETTIFYLQDRSIKNYSEFMEQEQPADNWSKVCRNKIEELDD